MADETKNVQDAQEEQKPEEQKEVEVTEEQKEDTSADTAKVDDTSSEEEVEVPKKFEKIVKEIEEMPVLELNELVKVFEKKFGVSAAAVAAAPGAGGDGGDAAEEKSSFTVELTNAGDQKIQVIKAVKSILGLGLKEAKDMVEGAPQVLKEDVKKEEAEEMKSQIEAVGGTIELK